MQNALELHMRFRALMPALPPYLRLPLLQQHARSGFSFYRGREEAVHYDRLRRLIVECSCGRESIEATWPCTYLPSINFFGGGLAGADDKFPVTRAATELMSDLRRKYPLRIPLLCGFFHFFVHPSGPRFAGPRWVKASYRWSGYDFGLGGEEFGSGWG